MLREIKTLLRASPSVIDVIDEAGFEARCMVAAALIPAIYGGSRVTRRAPLPVEQQAEYRPRFVTFSAAELYPEQSETPEAA